MKDWKKFLFGFLGATLLVTNVSAETYDVTDEATLRECFEQKAATCRLNSETITLENQLLVAKGNEITLDLNGKTLNLLDHSNYAITVKGNLTIEGDGTVNIPGLYGIGTSVNLGTLVIKGGTYNQAETGYYIIGNWNHVTIEGGTFNGSYCALNSFEYNGVQYKATVKGGTFNIMSEEDTTLLGYVTAEGGTYNQDVSDYVKDGYASRKIGEKYIVDKLYKVTSAETKNGTFTVDKETAIPGETVTITTKPTSTYEVKSIKVEGTEVKDNKFVMPESDVTVSVEFDKIIKTEIPSEEDAIVEKEAVLIVEDATKTDEIIKETLLKDETLLEELKDIEPKVSVYIGDIDMERFEEKAPELLKSFEDKKGNSIISKYFDVSLDILNSANDNYVTSIEELTDSITLKILLPDNLKNTDKNINRVYTIIREHDGVLETLPAKISSDGNYITFDTNKFSIYALAYEDKAVENANTPQTFDGVSSYMILGGIALLGIAGLCVYIKKRQIN